MFATHNKRGGRCLDDLDVLMAYMFSQHTEVQGQQRSTVSVNSEICRLAAREKKRRSHAAFLSDRHLNVNDKWMVFFFFLFLPSYLVRGNSHLGSDGSSSSDTLASIGPSLDDRRAILTSGVLEFMEELESKDTCLSAKNKLL